MKRAVGQLSLELIGTEGRIVANDQFATIHRSTADGVTATPIVPRWTENGFEAAIRDLLSALETGAPTQCLPSEARKAVAIIEGILASQAAGNARVAIG